MNSFSHYSFGAVTEWMFESLAGIDSDSPGFRHLTIRPGPPKAGSNPFYKPIDHARAEYDSIQGRIVNEWWVKGDSFKLDLTLPPNTTATVYLPTAAEWVTEERGESLSKAPGVRFLRLEGDRNVLEVQSGAYHFTAARVIE
jgi:alpha-L-rhamnosidase